MEVRGKTCEQAIEDCHRDIEELRERMRGRSFDLSIRPNAGIPSPELENLVYAAMRVLCAGGLFPRLHIQRLCVYHQTTSICVLLYTKNPKTTADPNSVLFFVSDDHISVQPCQDGHDLFIEPGPSSPAELALLFEKQLAAADARG